MSDVCKTVLIKSPNGPVRINESDYDEKEHTLHTAKAANKENDEQDAARQTVAPAGSVNPPSPIPPAPSAPIIDNPGSQTVAPSVPSPGDRFVMKEGSKHYVVDVNGNKIEADGIDPKGYKTDTDANAAILNAPQHHPAAS